MVKIDDIAYVGFLRCDRGTFADHHAVAFAEGPAAPPLPADLLD
jgi:hypothetical protein